MMTDSILFNFGRNMMYLRETTGGLTHAESLLQPPVPGNCMNWIVGHIAANRNRMLDLLGGEPTLDPAIARRYARDSAPVLGDEPGIGQLPDLLAAIEAAQERLHELLPTLPPERAAEQLTGPFPMPLGEMILFLMRHEAYHIGQLDFPHAQAIAARQQK